jgi:hypothetical protein
LDSGLVALAVLAFAVVASIIWAQPLTRLLVRGRRRQLRSVATGIASVLVFAAVLPSVLPYDHLLPDHDGVEHSAAEERAHSMHCHETPASCADAPISSGPGQFLTSEPLVLVPSMISVLILLALPVWSSFSRRPELPPPMFA